MHLIRPRRIFAFLALSACAVGLAVAQPAPLPLPEEEAAPPPAPVETADAPRVIVPAPGLEAPPASGAPAGEESEGVEVTVPPSEAPAAAAKAAPQLRPRHTAAVIQVLDKVTAESLRFEAPVHKLIRYKGLIFLVNTCQGGTSEEPISAAHLEIDSQPPALPGRPPNPVRQVFRGWMYADTPGPHPFEHPVYDAWLIACKTASGGA